MIGEWSPESMRRGNLWAKQEHFVAHFLDLLKLLLSIRVPYARIIQVTMETSQHCFPDFPRSSISEWHRRSANSRP
ncbi:hypothetical protein Hypma_014277 [Hypsizygus marmoreus]|uniref:Uncharacterized protein n=1 Tax=Hypsizygus marmoreus TaxID=39966 RepID=A0A369JFC0_HYPMA|nr:hypothetical protein Hypma_014277 [Hypsizygus marmoreus]